MVFIMLFVCIANFSYRYAFCPHINHSTPTIVITYCATDVIIAQEHCDMTEFPHFIWRQHCTHFGTFIEKYTPS